MKKFIFFILLFLALSQHVDAMSYYRAREEALFLTDKMSYELGLSNDQYVEVYDINLRYYAKISVTADIFGEFWIRRTNELKYVLTDWQFRRFLEREYFYKPVIYRNSHFYFPIYRHYRPRHYIGMVPPQYHRHIPRGRADAHHGRHGYGAPHRPRGEHELRMRSHGQPHNRDARGGGRRR